MTYDANQGWVYIPEANAWKNANTGQVDFLGVHGQVVERIPAGTTNVDLPAYGDYPHINDQIIPTSGNFGDRLSSGGTAGGIPTFGSSQNFPAGQYDPQGPVTPGAGDFTEGPSNFGGGIDFTDPGNVFSDYSLEQLFSQDMQNVLSGNFESQGTNQPPSFSDVPTNEEMSPSLFIPGQSLPPDVNPFDASVGNPGFNLQEPGFTGFSDNPGTIPSSEFDNGVTFNDEPLAYSHEDNPFLTPYSDPSVPAMTGLDNFGGNMSLGQMLESQFGQDYSPSSLYNPPQQLAPYSDPFSYQATGGLPDTQFNEPDSFSGFPAAPDQLDPSQLDNTSYPQFSSTEPDRQEPGFVDPTQGLMPSGNTSDPMTAYLDAVQQYGYGGFGYDAQGNPVGWNDPSWQSWQANSASPTPQTWQDNSGPTNQFIPTPEELAAAQALYGSGPVMGTVPVGSTPTFGYGQWGGGNFATDFSGNLLSSLLAGGAGGSGYADVTWDNNPTQGFTGYNSAFDPSPPSGIPANVQL